MLSFIAATILAALSPDHDDSDVITENDMLASANAEVLAWHACVQSSVRETVTNTLEMGSGSAGNAVQTGFAACVSQESALQAKLFARLGNAPSASEGIGHIMTEVRKVVDERALRTAVKVKIDFSQSRTCRSLKYSGGIPSERAAVCRQYGIR